LKTNGKQGTQGKATNSLEKQGKTGRALKNNKKQGTQGKARKRKEKKRIASKGKERYGGALKTMESKENREKRGKAR
jgi:hypothetical protein